MSRQDSLTIPQRRATSPMARPPTSETSNSPQMKTDIAFSKPSSAQHRDDTTFSDRQTELNEVSSVGSDSNRQKFLERKKLVEIKKKIDEGPFKLSPETEANLLELQQCSLAVRKNAIIHAWRRAQSALIENNMLHGNFPIHANAQHGLQQWINFSGNATDSIPLNGLGEPEDSWVSDPRFERTVVVLAKVYHLIKAMNGTVADRLGEKKLLISWFNEKDRLRYADGDPTDYLAQESYTTEMLRELAVYGFDRNGDLRDRYQDLVEEAYLAYDDLPPKELILITKDPEMDLIPPSDRKENSALDLFNMEIDEIQSYDLDQLHRSRSEWEEELAKLARQAQSITEEQDKLANELQRLKRKANKHKEGTNKCY